MFGKRWRWVSPLPASPGDPASVVRTPRCASALGVGRSGRPPCVRWRVPRTWFAGLFPARTRLPRGVSVPCRLSLASLPSGRSGGWARPPPAPPLPPVLRVRSEADRPLIRCLPDPVPFESAAGGSAPSPLLGSELWCGIPPRRSRPPVRPLASLLSTREPYVLKQNRLIPDRPFAHVPCAPRPGQGAPGCVGARSVPPNTLAHGRLPPDVGAGTAPMRCRRSPGPTHQRFGIIGGRVIRDGGRLVQSRMSRAKV
jgi:hypothetical protein